MSRGHVALFGLWMVLAAHGQAVAASIPSSQASAEDLLVRCDSLRQDNQFEAAVGLADSGLALVRSCGDSLLVTRFLTIKGRSLVSMGEAQEAEHTLWEAIDWAEALRDTLLLCDALDQQCFAVDAQGRPPRVVPLFERLIHIATLHGDTLYVARGQMLLGRRHMRSGEFDTARTLLQDARDGFHAIGEERNELNALNLLGVLEARLGSHALARQHWTRCLELAHRLEYTWMEANLLFNLAILDFRNGDPSLAPSKFMQAHDALRSIGRMRSAILPANEAAAALISLGRDSEAERILLEQLQTTREQGYSDLEARVLSLLGALDLERHRYHASAASFRAALVLTRPSKLINEAITATLGLSDALCRMDSAQAALDLLEEHALELRQRAEPLQQLELDGGWARVLLQLHRPADALLRLGAFEARAESLEARGTLVRLLPVAAEAQRGLGQHQRSLASLQRAARVWESERGVPRDPEWREERGSQGTRVYTELARALLEPSSADDEAVQRAFDALQRFKARTLLERMADPAAAGDTLEADSAPVTLAALQHDVLRDRELLLDAFLGPDVSWLFAVTRDTCRVVRLPGTEEGLHARLEIFRGLLTAPGRRASDTRSLETTVAAVRDLLFGDLTSECAAAERILFIPDGDLDLMPLDVLLSGSTGAAPHEIEIMRYPSATILARLRRSLTESPLQGTGTGLVALGGSAQRGTTALTGAQREIRTLQRRYDNVDVIVAGRDTVDVAAFPRYDILHVAAHTVVDDQNPWRSGIVLRGVPAERDAELAVSIHDAAGPGSSLERNRVENESQRILRAGSIASMRLRARLAVLSGCESAGGRVLSGEGILGLTAAFLSAGVPTVIATLWPVDDVVTEKLMTTFYAALADHQTVAAALRTAQSRIHSNSDTAHPFYWAGFVVIGNGTRSVDLSPRRGPRSIGLAGVIGLAAVALVWTAAYAWKRQRLALSGEQKERTKT